MASKNTVDIKEAEEYTIVVDFEEQVFLLNLHLNGNSSHHRRLSFIIVIGLIPLHKSTHS